MKKNWEDYWNVDRFIWVYCVIDYSIAFGMAWHAEIVKLLDRCGWGWFKSNKKKYVLTVGYKGYKKCICS